MKICRFQVGTNAPRIGILVEDAIVDLAMADIGTLTELLEGSALAARLGELVRRPLPRVPVAEAKLLSPVERQEIWAAGVTYLRSKAARMEESSFSARAYDQVYEAARPELFYKSSPEKTVGPGEAVGIRRDAKWSVPEPELALVINSRGEVVGYTVGNDMSSRDIEGENLLYLPQAKIYERSCALGPCITVGVTDADARGWSIHLDIQRAGQTVFHGETSANRMKRLFGELAEWLFRSQKFPHGAILLTGTGIVPPDDFTLQSGDQVRIQISGVGVLQNEVVTV
jgi:2-dehydro-3-deoxy-D-arabinonate dehydratase